MNSPARLGAVLWRSRVFRVVATTVVGSGTTVACTSIYDARSMHSSSLQAPSSLVFSPPVWRQLMYADAPSTGMQSRNGEISHKTVSERKDGLPTYRAADVQANNGKQGSGRIWVTLGDAVYDITDFVGSHPGGDRILLAAGGPLEPYFKAYPQHEEQFVYEILDEMRIGNLESCSTGGLLAKKSGGDKLMSDKDLSASLDPFANDPQRDSRLSVSSPKPFNAEPPSDLLVKDQITPNSVFYVRNHLPVPLVNMEQYELDLCDGSGESLASFSLQELKEKFEKHTIVATIQCAGNRRDEMSKIKPVKGGSWKFGAIGNATWTGVRLRDVLSAAGVQLSDIEDRTVNNRPVNHVVFEGLDRDSMTKEHYEGSIPLDVLMRVPDVLLAYEMNGEPLPPDHGFPLRVVIPGIVGARSVKWVTKISLAAEESTSHWQRNDYKSFCPSVDWNTVDFGSAPAIQEMPVQSAICTAVRDADRPNTAHVEGYAWSGDGKGIIRVDVSCDGGQSWIAADLLPRESDTGGEKTRNRVYEWTRWTADVKCTDGGQCQIVCKATDSAYNTQPERVESIWNIRGLVNNSWHRVYHDATKETNANA